MAPFIDDVYSESVKDVAFLSFAAEPYTFKCEPSKAALVVIDMQRDFLLDNGFGHIECGPTGDMQAVRDAVKPTLAVLKAFRALGLTVLHTREGHRPDLRDLPAPKLLRQARAPKSQYHAVIGDPAPMGRLLTRGEYGHDIIDELQPVAGEVVIDKPGKGAFFNTAIFEKLVDRGITHVIIAGVTVECCVTTTAREASDRGFEVCILQDCTDGYCAPFKGSSLDMFKFSDGLFGFVGTSSSLLTSLQELGAAKKASSKTTWNGSMDLSALKDAYSAGLSPVDVVKKVIEKIKVDMEEHPNAWINLIPDEDILMRASALEQTRNLKLPLYGIPFSVKDSVDVAGLPTTASCPGFAYTPTKHATVVSRLLDAGAIVIGKSNLDQFATGLVGTRSAYGMVHSVCNPDRTSGGSSSGAAVGVALGEVTFAVGTDTAGSGRVPAAFNNIVGLKPTKGTISTVGLVAACPTLDCITVFARSTEEARQAWLVMKEYDPADPFAKSIREMTEPTRAFLHDESTYTYGLPSAGTIEAHLSPAYQQHWQQKIVPAVRRLKHASQVDFDVEAYLSASDLMYKGSFVAERLDAFKHFLSRSASSLSIEEAIEQLIPPVRTILTNATALTAQDAFSSIYAAARLTKRINASFDKADFLILPTAPKHPTLEEVENDPIGENLKLGTFVSAGNILDLAVIALPAGFTEEGTPFGISLVGPAFTESKLMELARRLQQVL